MATSSSPWARATSAPWRTRSRLRSRHCCRRGARRDARRGPAVPGARAARRAPKPPHLLARRGTRGGVLQSARPRRAGGVPAHRALGGALAMNAGAFGGETWRHVLSVETIDRGGETHQRAAGEYRVGYREVIAPAPEEWFIAASLSFERRAGAHEGEVRALLEQRRASQPIGEWSCGSVFTNPPGDHAARLIEGAGLKGFRIGDASVSQKHANFIINHGQASAADLERLIAHVRDTVQRVHGVALQPEVRIVGVP